MILTNAAEKVDFYLIQYFGIKMSPVPRHTQCQDVLGVKMSRQAVQRHWSRQAVLLCPCQLIQHS